MPIRYFHGNATDWRDTHFQYVKYTIKYYEQYVAKPHKLRVHYWSRVQPPFSWPHYSHFTPHSMTRCIRLSSNPTVNPLSSNTFHISLAPFTSFNTLMCYIRLWPRITSKSVHIYTQQKASKLRKFCFKHDVVNYTLNMSNPFLYIPLKYM